MDNKVYSLYELLPINIDDFLNSMNYLKSHCKYFSIGDVLSLSFTNPMVPGYAHRITKFATHEMTFFNLPFFSHYISQKSPESGQNKEVFTINDDFMYYGTLGQLQNYILGNIYKAIMWTKMLCSSFFLWEALDVISYCPYGIYGNVFFNNWNEFLAFCEFNKIVVEPYIQQENVYEAYKSLNYKGNLHIPENFVVLHDNTFCKNAIVSDLQHKDQFNTENYYYDQLFISLKPKESRVVFVNHNQNSHHSTLYEIYMHDVLKLEKKSLTKTLYEELIDFFKKDKPLCKNFKLQFPHSVNFLETLKPNVLCINRQLFYQNINGTTPLFFLFINANLLSIKAFARKKSYSSIVVINLSDCSETLYNIRKTSSSLGYILRY